MKRKIPLKQAQPLAGKINSALSPGCQRIEIAGSIRRLKPTVGDVEIVCIPVFYPNLFGEAEGQSKLDGVIDKLLNSGKLIRGDKNGPLYKQFFIPSADNLQLDLFITTPAKWGYTMAIRTGDADFSRLLVTPLQQGGLMPSYLKARNSQYWEGNTVHPTPEETDVFDLCGGWIPPFERVGK